MTMADRANEPDWLSVVQVDILFRLINNIYFWYNVIGGDHMRVFLAGKKT